MANKKSADASRNRLTFIVHVYVNLHDTKTIPCLKTQKCKMPSNEERSAV